MSGSTALLLSERRPRHREIGPGRDEPKAGGQFLARALQFPGERKRQSTAGAVAADRNAARRISELEQAPPRGQRVVVSGGERMLGREAIADGERAHLPCPSGFGHHPAVAHDRARAISPAVKEHQHPGRVAAGSDRPFARHAVEIGRLELDVAGDRPDRADFVKALAASLPAHRARLGAKQSANGVDFALGH